MMHKTFSVDRLQVRIYPDRRKMGVAAAQDVSDRIRQLAAGQDNIRMIFAAAPSQEELLKDLAADHSIPWESVTAFQMDEYIGLPPGAEQSFRRFLEERLILKVPVGAWHPIDGTAADPEKECRRYALLLQEAPVEIVCLGIGENGHIAFNDPPVADFSDPVPVKLVELDHACRRQQVNDGCFPSIEEVPGHAITLTIPSLMAGKHLHCVVPGPTKAEAVRETLKGQVTTSCPASVLRNHPSAILYLDEQSAGKL